MPSIYRNFGLPYGAKQRAIRCLIPLERLVLQALPLIFFYSNTDSLIYNISRSNKNPIFFDQLD